MARGFAPKVLSRRRFAFPPTRPESIFESGDTPDPGRKPEVSGTFLCFWCIDLARREGEKNESGSYPQAPTRFRRVGTLDCPFATLEQVRWWFCWRLPRRGQSSTLPGKINKKGQECHRPLQEHCQGHSPLRRRDNAALQVECRDPYGVAVGPVVCAVQVVDTSCR